jgi:integration host factor subunit beta
MLKSDLILSINKDYISLSHNDIELITDFFFKKIVESLKEDKNLEIRGFGTFSKKINKEKYVRNPKTNEKIFKKQNFKVHFKIGKILHQRINSFQ